MRSPSQFKLYIYPIGVIVCLGTASHIALPIRVLPWQLSRGVIRQDLSHGILLGSKFILFPSSGIARRGVLRYETKGRDWFQVLVQMVTE